MSFRSSENLNRMSAVAGVALTQNDTFPARSLSGVGLDIVNNDDTTDLIFRVKKAGGDYSNNYRVTAGTAYDSLFPLFTEIDIIQTTTSFDIVVKESTK